MSEDLKFRMGTAPVEEEPEIEMSNEDFLKVLEQKTRALAKESEKDSAKYDIFVALFKAVLAYQKYLGIKNDDDDIKI